MSCGQASLILYLQVFARLKLAAFQFIMKEEAIYYPAEAVRQSKVNIKLNVYMPVQPGKVGAKLSSSSSLFRKLLGIQDAGNFSELDDTGLH